MAKLTTEQKIDAIFVISRDLVEAGVGGMQDLAARSCSSDAAEIMVSAYLSSVVGIYKTWAVATGLPYDEAYLRAGLDRVLRQNFMVAERREDGSFGDARPMQ